MVGLVKGRLEHVLDAQPAADGPDFGGDFPGQRLTFQNAGAGQEQERLLRTNTQSFALKRRENNGFYGCRAHGRQCVDLL